MSIESMPKFEQSESLRDRLVRLIKERGLEDLEVKKHLDDFISEQQKKVEQLEGADYKIGQIELNLEMARLYRDAEKVEFALESYDDVLNQVYQEFGDCEFYWKVYDEFESIKNQ